MKKILASLLAAGLLLSAAGCTKTTPVAQDTPDNMSENTATAEQHYEEYTSYIYLCDDVYRTDDTPTHGTGTISLPMARDVFTVEHYDILLCGDGCDPTDVVSRAFWGYAYAWKLDKYEAHTSDDGWSFNTRRYINEVPEKIKAQMISQGAPESVTDPRDYIYLLTLDEKHYAYIYLKGTEGTERLKNESDLADSIVKNAKITFAPSGEKIKLTIERVIRLSQNKGESLSWDDFEMYNAADVGSGLYILKYEIDEAFDLMIGGVPGSSPMYIRLVTKADRENYIDIRTENVEAFVSQVKEKAALTEHSTELYLKTKAFLDEEFHRVFDPYYDIKSLTISGWEENGNEAIFHYKMIHTFYNKDPDTVDYIKKAKDAGSTSYETLYNDYLAEKEANCIYKVILNGDTLELYANASPNSEDWQPIKIDDYILSGN